MGTERPTKGVLSFQCDVCYDTHEFTKADGDPINDYMACWRTMKDEGWSMNDGSHLCDDCTQIAKSDRARRI